MAALISAAVLAACAAAIAGWALRGNRGSIEQSDLAEDPRRVRVDVLALDQAVLERDHVDSRPRSSSPRLGGEVTASHRVGVRAVAVHSW